MLVEIQPSIPTSASVDDKQVNEWFKDLVSGQVIDMLVYCF